MRLSGARCGACGAAKAFVQRPLLMVGLLIILGAAVATITLSQPPVDGTTL